MYATPTRSVVPNIPALHRTTPHRFCPYIPILGTHSISPPSALFRAHSPTHPRHSVVLTRSTTPSPFPALLSPRSRHLSRVSHPQGVHLRPSRPPPAHGPPTSPP